MVSSSSSSLISTTVVLCALLIPNLSCVKTRLLLCLSWSASSLLLCLSFRAQSSIRWWKHVRGSLHSGSSGRGISDGWSICPPVGGTPNSNNWGCCWLSCLLPGCILRSKCSSGRGLTTWGRGCPWCSFPPIEAYYHWASSQHGQSLQCSGPRFLLIVLFFTQTTTSWRMFYYENFFIHILK